MRIIIADDSVKNLEAAKKAAEQFPEHQFVFMNNASEAFSMIASADAVITDLFFPDEDHGRNSVLGKAYAGYIAGLQDQGAYLRVLEGYYAGNTEKATSKLECAIGMATDGTNRVAIEKRMRSFENGAGSPETDRGQLENLPPAQFPYGGAVMLEAHKLGKKLCLISDIHSHASTHKDNASSVDGMVILLPLIGKDIVSVEEVSSDGRECLKYIGQRELWRAIGGYPLERQKEWVEVWIEAIRRVTAQ